jgi:hypothetical protein
MRFTDWVVGERDLNLLVFSSSDDTNLIVESETFIIAANHVANLNNLLHCMPLVCG